jgi:hypothetical protein
LGDACPSISVASIVAETSIVGVNSRIESCALS